MTEDKHKDLIERALLFATEKHKGQNRKNSTEGYIIHPISVSNRVSEFTDNPIQIAAALLHDTVEDTNTTLEELSEHFPDEVISIVEELTLDKDRYEIPNKDELDLKTYNELKMKKKGPYIVEEINHLSKEARLIKFADKENNVSDLEHGEPIFANRYAREAQYILDNIEITPSKAEKIIIKSIRQKINDFMSK